MFLSIVKVAKTLHTYNYNRYTQKHYKGPDDGIKPKLVARMLQTINFMCTKNIVVLWLKLKYVCTCSFIISTMGCPV